VLDRVGSHCGEVGNAAVNMSDLDERTTASGTTLIATASSG
jgi:hypothetical protein